MLGLSCPMPCDGQGREGWVGRRTGGCVGMGLPRVSSFGITSTSASLREECASFPEADWLRAGMETKSHKYLWTRGFKFF